VVQRRCQAKEKIVAFTDGLKSAATLMVGGMIGVALAPAVAPALARVARPAAKAGIRAGLLLYGRGRIAAAELRETLEDITAEVQAEFDAEKAQDRPEPAGSAAPPEIVRAGSPEVVH
jgi:hypothetical protein